MWIPSQEESALLVVGSTVLKMNFLELSAADPTRAGGRGRSGGVAQENLRGLLSKEQLVKVKGPEVL